MKKLNFFKWQIPAIIFAGAIIVFACQKQQETLTQNNLKSDSALGMLSGKNPHNHTINTQLLENWDSIRTDTTKVKQIFANGGNTFSFEMPGDFYTSTTVHAYLGYHSTTEQLSLTLVDSIFDSATNDKGIISINLDHTPKKSLPKLGYQNVDAHSISYEEASTNINRWMDDAQRNQWIRNYFDINATNGGLAQVFTIKLLHLNKGNKHTFYLALKDEMINGVSVTVPDIIMVNEYVSETDVISDDIQLVTLIDKGTPCPPICGKKKGKYGQLQ